jgi:hypothetical protein
MKQRFKGPMRRGMSYIQYKWRRLTGLVTSGVRTDLQTRYCRKYGTEVKRRKKR